MDFSKAFDSIDHTLLWKKLAKMNISQQMLEMLQSIYSTAVSCVKLSVSESFPCQKGVRQGCNLSPLLFNLFTADLQKELRKNESGVELHDSVFLDLLMYADDIFLISSSAVGLRKHLHTLQEYSTKWKLDVNTDKTKVCVFGRDTDCQAFTWKNSTIDKVKSYKYLGVWLSKNAKFNKAREYLSNQAKKTSFALLTILRRLNHPPPPPPPRYAGPETI